ncbi:MAG TPA: site-specific integrase [Kineosporiaceae bacterium]
MDRNDSPAAGSPALVSYAAAVDRYLHAAGVSTGSARVYRVSLTTWCWLFAGEQPPAGSARRGAVPPPLSLASLDEPDTAVRVATAYRTRANAVDADTVNRELSVVRAAIGWWRAQSWLTTDPTSGLHRRPSPPDRTRALSAGQVAALWRLDVDLREKTYWRLLYETAARADELLRMNVEDLDLANKRGRIIAKGGAVEWVHWQSGSAQLLPRLLGRRTRGPVFLTDRCAPARTPTLDTCPETRRARLSYRRASELFEQATRVLADPQRRQQGWVLHQLRHSALTHEAESGTSTPMLLARSRHASVRSLERYARPGVDAVAAHVAARDPAARRNR